MKDCGETLSLFAHHISQVEKRGCAVVYRPRLEPCRPAEDSSGEIKLENGGLDGEITQMWYADPASISHVPKYRGRKSLQ